MGPCGSALGSMCQDARGAPPTPSFEIGRPDCHRRGSLPSSSKLPVGPGVSSLLSGGAGGPKWWLCCSLFSRSSVLAKRMSEVTCKVRPPGTASLLSAQILFSFFAGLPPHRSARCDSHWGHNSSSCGGLLRLVERLSPLRPCGRGSCCCLPGHQPGVHWRVFIGRHS